jgi:4-alpha-glucanotransferase
MRFSRSSGVLLHPTSLPGAWSIGDLGAHAYRFVDFLHQASQTLWQILPLGPTGYGDSPYQCFSAMAGNVLLISPERLVEAGLLNQADLEQIAAPHQATFPSPTVDYEISHAFKSAMLARSFEHFRSHGSAVQHDAFVEFCREQVGWLDDYALFIALKQQHDGASWHTWDRDLARRKKSAIKRAGEQLRDQVELEKYKQYIFFSQWLPLKAYANERGIRIMGDMPIFVAYDGADVWANPQLFYLDEDGLPTVVAGVPPDYFSATGQLWGNPLYCWDQMAKRGYSWWTERISVALQVYDMLRIDHFRGFAAYWEVPANEETAINGQWVPGPGAALFKAIERKLGQLPLIAEDLGLITEDVHELRDQFDLPGMIVLQFAFGGKADNIYLPHNHHKNTVVYTGTHDNDTTIGWFDNLDVASREHVRRYLGHSADDIAWDLLRMALASVGDMAIIPLQDLLRLDSSARMNTPGVPSGNWAWRFAEHELSDGLAEGLRLLTETYGRIAE